MKTRKRLMSLLKTSLALTLLITPLARAEKVLNEKDQVALAEYVRQCEINEMDITYYKNNMERMELELQQKDLPAVSKAGYFLFGLVLGAVVISAAKQ